MRILIRNNKSEEWRVAESVTARAEAELQELLAESPSLIPVDEIREGVSPLVLAVQEFGLPGSGNTDILAFSPDGDIAIIECKLATNPESKRKVIGQILEYGAHLWEMDYTQIDARIQTLKGNGLSELVEEAVAGEWDEESFRTGVQQSLESGSFILTIVVDEINDDLRRTIRYVNECSKSAFSLHALEMRRFRAESVEVVVPHLYGAAARPPKAGGRKWTKEEFFGALSNNVESKIADRVRDLYDWAEEVADRIWFGVGAERGSWTFHYREAGETVSVFTVFTDDRLQLNYGWLSTKIEKETMEEFHNLIHQIPPFRHIPPDFSKKFPSIRVADAFADQDSTERFKDAVLWLRQRIHPGV